MWKYLDKLHSVITCPPMPSPCSPFILPSPCPPFFMPSPSLLLPSHCPPFPSIPSALPLTSPCPPFFLPYPCTPFLLNICTSNLVLLIFLHLFCHQFDAHHGGMRFWSCPLLSPCPSMTVPSMPNHAHLSPPTVMYSMHEDGRAWVGMGGHGRALWWEGRRAFVGMENHGRAGGHRFVFKFTLTHNFVSFKKMKKCTCT